MSFKSFLRILTYARSVLFAIAILTNMTRPLTAQTAGPSANESAPQPSIAIERSTLPDHPKAQRVIDKKFVGVMAGLGATESMRFTSRQLVIENEKSAGAPWITNVPSHSRLVFRYAPIFTAEFFVAYELKKPHAWLPGDRALRKFWWLYPVTMGALHFHNAMGNIYTQPLRF